MLLLLSNTYTRTKFSCVTMNSQNQEPPLNASTTVPHCCQQLFLSISSYTKKNSSQKVCNRYILSFQTKVGNRSIYDNKVSCFISSFYCFCCVPCVPILCWKSWSFLLVVEHQQCHVPPISPFYQRNWYVGPFCGAFLGQICLCFGGRMVLAPTLNSNSSRSHSIKSLLSAQFKRF